MASLREAGIGSENAFPQGHSLGHRQPPAAIGEPYEVIVLRGGINGAGVIRGLEIGNGLDEYIRRVTPEAGSGFVVRFIFINVLGY